MKISLRVSIFISFTIIAASFLLSIPKDAKASDVIAKNFKEYLKLCPDGSMTVMRCRVGGSFCNVSNQVPCP